MNEPQFYPIKVVSRQTGLSQHVIRAWEKRYGVVTPQRTETNRRSYTSEDIHHLTLLKLAVDNDYSISSVAELTTERLEALVSEALPSQATNQAVTGQSEVDPAALYETCLDAVMEFDSGKLEDGLTQASLALTQPVLLEQVIIPLMVSIGERWREGSIRIMQEHLSTAVIGGFLTSQRQRYRPSPSAPVIVVATPAGQQHQVGALIVALVAAAEGWKVVYLGADLPAEEVAAACIKEQARAVALSLVYPAEDPQLHLELERIKSLLPAETRMIIGGRVSEHYTAVIQKISAWSGGSLSEFRNYLQHIELNR